MDGDDVNSKKDNSNDDDDDNLNEELSNMMNIDSSRGSINRNCLCCLKEVEGCSRCSQCRTALYCNRECQLKHWPVHKNICQDSNNTENSDQKIIAKAANHCEQGNSVYKYNNDSSIIM